MIQPDFKTFSRMARHGNLVPVYATFTADLLTPVSAYLRLARHAHYAFLLESVEGGEKIARYTFVGANPVEVFRYVRGACVLEGEGRVSWVQANPLDFLRHRVERYRPVRVPGLPPLVAGAIGYFSYDMVRLFERIPDTGRDDVGADDAAMMFFLGMVVFDHVQHQVWIVRNVFTDGEGSLRSKYLAALREIEATRKLLDQPLATEQSGGMAGEMAGEKMRGRAKERLAITSNTTRGRFEAGVRKAKRYIRAGDIFQVVLSRRTDVRTDADPFDLYRALRVVNPSPYMYFLKLADTAVVGSSPEMLVKVQGRDAFYRPIAGTRRRGRDDADDQRLEAEMLADPKECAEHVMLVDLGRNDLGRVCEYGSVKVERFGFVERYSHVMHMVSSLRGKLRADVDCFDALAACFPAGTLTGAPKVRAMEIIDELEPTRRGIYGGAILYLDFSGNLDSCIAIRTIVVKKGVAHLQAGAGLVADSVPAHEYQETINKQGALLAALEEANAEAAANHNAKRHGKSPRRKQSGRKRADRKKAKRAKAK